MASNVIGRPSTVEGLIRSRTPEEYRQKQKSILALKNLSPDVVHEVTTEQPAYVGAGVWRVRCPECFEAPSADPDWNLSCCCGCGAVFTNIKFPTDRNAIETILLKRPNPANRNWLPEETLEQLSAENLAHGDQV